MDSNYIYIYIYILYMENPKFQQKIINIQCISMISTTPGFTKI